MNKIKHLSWSDNENKERKKPEQNTEVVFIQVCHSVPTRNNLSKYILCRLSKSHFIHECTKSFTRQTSI